MATKTSKKKTPNKPFRAFMITDINGRRLRVTKNRLTEIDKDERGMHPPFFILLSDLRKYGGRAKLHAVNETLNDDYIYVSAFADHIGCHHFSPKNFTRILQVAGFTKCQIEARRLGEVG